MAADLFDQHKQMILAAEALLAAVRRNPPSSIREIAQLRANFANIVRLHLHEESEQIIAPLVASGRMDELPRARAMITDMRMAHSDYSDHVRKWTMQSVDTDREGYARSISAMLDALRRFTAREEAELYWPALRLFKAREHLIKPS